jgi:hypothetical protein
MTSATAAAPVAHRGRSGLRRLGPALGTLLERLTDDDVVAAGAPRRYRAMAGGPMPSAMTQPSPEEDR